VAERSATAEKPPEQSGSAGHVEKNFSALVQAVLATRAADETRPVLIMAEDEGRFGLMNTLRSGWAPKPPRPGAARPMLRDSLSIFAAACPQCGPVTTWILPSPQSQRMTLVLTHVAAALAASCLVMVVDRAGWPLGHEGTGPANMQLPIILLTRLRISKPHEVRA